MDLISKSLIEVNTLALDGLATRNKALIANIANADTPSYQRTDVKFEDQLHRIVQNKNMLQKEKEDYSAGLVYSPSMVPTGPSSDKMSRLLSMASGAYDSSGHSSDLYGGYKPEIMNTNEPPMNTNGNNVNIEYEMAELAKNGTKYAAISTLQEKAFRGMQDIIRGAQ